MPSLSRSCSLSPGIAALGSLLPATSPCHEKRWMHGSFGRRSEEHTSELQSRQYLVCRLLLEKKRHQNIPSTCNANLLAHQPHDPPLLLLIPGAPDGAEHRSSELLLPTDCHHHYSLRLQRVVH